MEQRVTIVIQQKWLCKLLGLDYVIEYRRGKENVAANALFRINFDANCSVISAVIPTWMVELSNSYERDSNAVDNTMFIKTWKPS